MGRVSNKVRKKVRKVASFIEQVGLRHSVYRSLLKQLTKRKGNDFRALCKIFLDLEKRNILMDQFETLLYLQDEHPNPHLVNYLLALQEFSERKEIVQSFPTNVWMDLSSICNVECRFCKYTNDLLPKRIVSFEEVEDIEWFKYVRALNLSAGTAESLTNPKFIDIFNFMRSNNPHLHISLLTNGKALNDKVLNILAGRLDALHISMNASNERDYNQIIKGGNWKKFESNMRNMRKILNGTDRPKISASFVMMQGNINRALEYLEFAAEHGASFVLFHHFYVPHLRYYHMKNLQALTEKFSKTDSLYYQKENSDRAFKMVKKRAQELGVQVQLPLPFSSSNSYINFGERSKTLSSEECKAPWMNMYLLWGIKSKREEIAICCGLAHDIGVYFDRAAVATKEGLLQTWNSPTLRAFRRSANKPSCNPICKLCREIDRFDPEAPFPNQALFFEFNQLPLPRHFVEESLNDRIKL